MDNQQRPEERPQLSACLICGKKAVYNFYGALACDSCRTFFRRYLTQKKPSKCVNLDNKCDIKASNRRECAKCRYIKCISVGMRPQLVASASAAPHSMALVPKEAASQAVVDRKRRSAYSAALSDPALALDTSRLMSLINGGKKLVPLDPQLKLKIAILRPVIPTIDLIVLDLKDTERDRLLELFEIASNLKLISPEDTSQLVGDHKKDVYTIAFTCISRVVRVLKTLTGFRQLSEMDQEILLREAASEIWFYRSLPHLDHDIQYWTVYKNPVTKEESEDAPKLPAAMIQSISDEIYEQYVTMVTGLFPEIREDFVLSIIITAIIFYDPDRPDLRDRELVRKEQDLFYNILIKYLVLKFGFQGIKTRLQGVTLRERVNSRILVYLRRMKKLFEQTVIYPNFRIIEDQTQLSIKSN